jgi:hypothetical protein
LFIPNTIKNKSFASLEVTNVFSVKQKTDLRIKMSIHVKFIFLGCRRFNSFPFKYILLSDKFICPVIYLLINIVISRLKVGIVEQIDAAIVRQRLSKNASAATDTHATTGEQLEAVFSMQTLPRP